MIALYIVLGILGLLLIFYIAPTAVGSYVIYKILFVRDKPEKWSRSVSWDNEEQQKMFDTGKKWGEENEQYHRSFDIRNDGFKLVAEYFDFGNDRAVIIIPGRMESGTYSYYFSEPYKQAGFNVLAIDNRSHGLSEGKYNNIGLKEYRDIIAWAKFLHDEVGVKQVIVHGLCIGSATALYALVDESCPDYVTAMVADGMYINFQESLNNHLIERKKPVFPFSPEVMFLVQIHAGKNPKKFSPINLMPKLKKPILFIYSLEDTYSVPKYGQLLYDTCTAPKRIEWFDHGVHSHVRINDPEKYDLTIKKFVEDFIDEK